MHKIRTSLLFFLSYRFISHTYKKHTEKKMHKYLETKSGATTWWAAWIIGKREGLCDGCWGCVFYERERKQNWVKFFDLKSHKFIIRLTAHLISRKKCRLNWVVHSRLFHETFFSKKISSTHFEKAQPLIRPSLLLNRSHTVAHHIAAHVDFVYMPKSKFS